MGEGAETAALIALAMALVRLVERLFDKILKARARSKDGGGEKGAPSCPALGPIAGLHRLSREHAETHRHMVDLLEQLTDSLKDSTKELRDFRLESAKALALLAPGNRG